MFTLMLKVAVPISLGEFMDKNEVAHAVPEVDAPVTAWSSHYPSKNTVSFSRTLRVMKSPASFSF